MQFRRCRKPSRRMMRIWSANPAWCRSKWAARPRLRRWLFPSRLPPLLAADLGMAYAFGVEFLELGLGSDTEREFCTDLQNEKAFTAMP